MKSVIPWVLVVALLAGVFFLFSAGKQKDAELAQLRPQADEVARLQKENEDLKKQIPPADEVAKLRKDNEDLLRLRNEVRQLREHSKELTNQIQSVQRTEAQRAQQLAAENEALKNQSQQVQEANARTEALVRNQAAATAGACINILRQLDGAKQQWALEAGKTVTAVPTPADLQPYFVGGAFPACPAGGVYTLNAVGLPPTCSMPGHALPKK